MGDHKTVSNSNTTYKITKTQGFGSICIERLQNKLQPNYWTDLIKKQFAYFTLLYFTTLDYLL
jgi:hypothetical protein